MAALDYSFVHRVIDGLGMILDTTPGSPDSGSYITEAQLRDWIKGQTVQEGYYYNGNFYSDSGHTSVMAKVNGSLYVDKGSNALYYCLSSAYVALTEEAAVQAIRTELLNGTLEPLVSTKARQDQNGNVIDTTYATKAELTTEQNARESADSDLQSQIVNINSEVDNVEALIGGDAQVENIDPTEGESLLAQSRLIHHTNLLPYGSFGRVGARSVAWNQLLNKNNFPASTTYNNGNLVYTNNGDGSITLRTTATTTADVTIALESVTSAKGAVSGHTYVFKGGASGVKFGTGNGAGINEEGTGRVAVVTFSSSISMGYLIPSGTTIATAVTLYPLLCDLTTMNMASLTADQFRSLFPASYYPYNAGTIYDLNPTGFRIRGINLWDEETETGYYNSSGAPVAGSNYLRSKNALVVSPSTDYCFSIQDISSFSSHMASLFFYDASDNYISQTSFYKAGGKAQSFTTPNNAHYLRFYLSDYYGTSYKNDIQICYNSLPTALKTAYHASDHHTVYTPQIADGHYVNENCYDYVENVTEDGIVKGKKHTVVGSVDLGTLNWTYNGTFFYSLDLASVIKRPASGADLPNIIVAIYERVIPNNLLAKPKQISVGETNGRINIYDTSYSDATSFKASLSGVIIYYELATESITDVEPLRSFGISDYSIVEPITPQDELVNRIDVPFSVKSVSANTLIEQITQNTVDIAEEKATRTAQVSALNKRVTNLELKTGDQFTVDYPSDTYGINGVPANVEPYAEVSVLKGVGRIANNIARGAYSRTVEGLTITYDSTTKRITITGTATATGDYTFFSQGQADYVAGHKYLVFTDCKSSLKLSNNDIGVDFVGSTLLDFSQRTVFIGINAVSGQTYNEDFFVCITDLTVYFNRNIPSGLDIATIQQNYPELLIPSDYGTSVVFPTYTGVVSKSNNLIDEADYSELALLTYADDYFSNTIADTRSFFQLAIQAVVSGSTQTLNQINVESVGRKSITFTTPSAKIETLVIKHNGSTRDFSARFEINLPVSTRMTLSMDVTGYSPTVAGGVRFGKLKLEEGTTATDYTPYGAIDTLTLPEPVTLKGAGSVAEEYYTKTGRMTHPIGEVTITSSNLSDPTDNGNRAVFGVTLTSAVKYTSASDVPNMLMAGFVPATQNATWVSGMVSASTANTNVLYVIMPTGTTKADMLSLHGGDSIYYELATPSVDTYIDPLPDNYVQVEPNGTIKAVQSQSPEVDSAMTIEYMAS